MNEPEVVQRTRDFLRQWTLDDEPIARVFTDPHPTLLNIGSLEPFQRFRIPLAGQVVYPDLLAHVPTSGSLIAVEAKGSDANPLQGVAQAESYLEGVQHSFLALPATKVSPALVKQAEQHGVGVLSVSESVHPLSVVPARRPLERCYRALIQDIEGAAWVHEAGKFTFNLPTHYLVWLLLLDGDPEPSSLESSVQGGTGYPMPRDWRAALRGAVKLGLVESDGRHARLTDAGRVVRRVMPSLDAWARIHELLTDRSSKRVLCDLEPASAGSLSLLLLQDPLVRLLMAGLAIADDRGVSFWELARACAALDPRRTAIFFLKPASAAALMRSEDGSIDWSKVCAGDFRSTTFFQYKSILKHAGLLAATALGGASTKAYDPAKDMWRRGPL